MKARALRRLRREERNEDRKVTSPFFDQTCPEGTCPLVLEHFVGTGLIYAISLAVSFLALMAETSVSKLGRPSRNRKQNNSLQLAQVLKTVKLRFNYTYILILFKIHHLTSTPQIKV